MDFNASGEPNYLHEDKIGSALEEMLNFKIEMLEEQRDQIKEEVIKLYRKRKKENTSKEEIDKFIYILLEKLELKNRFDPVTGKYTDEI